MEQLYDPVRALFVADRHVRGTCPRCGAAEQPGDNCDACGATYDATEAGRAAVCAVRRRPAAQVVLTLLLRFAVYLKPILPAMAAKAEAFLNIDELTWDDAATPLLDHSIDTFRPLLTRIDKNDVDRVVEATKAEAHDR